MSVIGFDFGNENCFIAVARAGGIETLANEYSQRVTPSYVAFGDKSRDLGVSAKNKQVTNLKNTVYGFKRLIGRKFRDPAVQQEITYLPFTVCELPGDNIGIKVRYLNEDTTFSVQQITAMLLTKLKEIAESNLKIKVTDCVISVPSFFTDSERRALLDSAQIAGLEVLRLMNEPTAVALSYGFYKQDLAEDKPRNIVFIDMGHSSLQITAVAFTKGKLKVLATVWEANIGGRDFDNALVRYFAEDFQARYNLKVMENRRAVIRLLTECEKLKKQMSANTNQLPLNIECFMEDKDVAGRMCREDFENMCSGLFAKVEHTMKKILVDAKLKLDDIEAVELVGGSTRIPAIKQMVRTVYGKEPSTTLNLDEAVARGCALQCAMLSPAFKVRDFEITDVQPYPIKLLWNADKAENGEMEVFPRYHKIPFYKKLTFMRSEPFTIQGKYSDNSNIPYPPNNHLGTYLVQKVTPTPEGESSKVEVKVHVNIHGIFGVSSATLYEKIVPLEQNESQAEPMDDQEQTNAESYNKNTQSPKKNKEDDQQKQNGDIANNAGADEEMDKEQSQAQKKNKKVTKSTKLPIDAELPQLTQTELNNFIQAEANMIQQDRMEKEKADAKNTVEEYVYEMRNKLSDTLEKFISEADKDSFMKLLNDTEDWLYDEGEDQSKSVYVEKYAQLKKIGQPVVDRMREAEERPLALEELGRSLQLVRKAVQLHQAKDEQYSHIEDQEMERVHKALNEKQAWFDKQVGALNSCVLHQNPPVLVSQIRQEKDLFETTVKQVLNKPKPKVELPPENNGGAETETGNKPNGSPSKNNDSKSQQQSGQQETMETD